MIYDRLVILYLLGATVALFVGIDKGGVGGMLGTLGVPIMNQIMPINEAIIFVLPMLIFGDIFAIRTHWKIWDSLLLPKLLLSGVLGMFLGTFILVNISPYHLKILLVAVILIFFVYRLLERRLIGRLLYQPKNWHGFVGGAATGVTTTIANAGGPAITIYLLLQKLEPRVFVATAAAFFAALNVLKVPFYAAAGLFSGARLLPVVWLLPLVPIGVWLGKQFVTRIPPVIFEKIVLLLLLVAAGLLLRGTE